MQLKQFFSSEALGYSLLRFWSVALFTSALLFSAGAYSSEYAPLVHDASTFAFIGTLFLAPFLMRLSVFQKKGFALLCMLCMELGTVIVIASLEIQAFPVALLAAGAVLTGLGSAMLTLAWGYLFSKIPLTRVLAAATGAVILGRLFCLAATAMSPAILYAVVAGVPILSFILIRDEGIESAGALIAAEQDRIPSLTREDVSSLFSFSIGFVLLVSAVVGAINQYMRLYSVQPTNETFQIALIVACIVLALLMGLSRLANPRYFDRLLQLGILVPAVFLMLLPMESVNEGALRALASSSSTILRIMLWAMLARNCQQSKTSPFVIYGIGWGMQYVGIMVGELIVRGVFDPASPAQPTSVMFFSLAMMFLLVVAYMAAARPFRRQPHEGDAADARQEADPFSVAVGQVAERYGLSARETEILHYLARRCSSKEIQDALYLSASTVSTHTSNIYQKMGIHSKDEAVRIVKKWKEKTEAADEGAQDGQIK